MRATLPRITAVVCSPVAAPHSHEAVCQATWGWVGSVGPTVLPGTGFGSSVCVAGRALMGRRIEPCLVSGMPPLVLASASPLVGVGVNEAA